MRQIVPTPPSLFDHVFFFFTLSCTTAEEGSQAEIFYMHSFFFFFCRSYLSKEFISFRPSFARPSALFTLQAAKAEVTAWIQRDSERCFSGPDFITSCLDL